MNVREALATICEEQWDGVGELLDVLAPIIERALRAAYRTGVQDQMDKLSNISDNGVTAGVAALVEGL